jgi:hypothetical protein
MASICFNLGQRRTGEDLCHPVPDATLSIMADLWRAWDAVSREEV